LVWNLKIPVTPKGNTNSHDLTSKKLTGSGEEEKRMGAGGREGGIKTFQN